MGLAVQDRDAILTHVAFHWDDGLSVWQLLSLGRSEKEINERVSYWVGKGTRKCDIQIFEMNRR